MDTVDRMENGRDGSQFDHSEVVSNRGYYPDDRDRMNTAKFRPKVDYDRDEDRFEMSSNRSYYGGDTREREHTKYRQKMEVGNGRHARSRDYPPPPPSEISSHQTVNYHPHKEEEDTDDRAATAGIMLKAGLALAIVIGLAALIIAIIAYESTISLRATTDLLESDSPLDIQYPISCRSLDSSLASGLYIIRPNPSMIQFPVYCDMKTDGGGWTLVAAVHENNIDGKCTSGDKWSSEQGHDAKNTRGSLNWENMVVFGGVEDVTNGDYKNPAYFALETSNVMIWHVPNGRKISDISEQAFLKYYTRNGFLANNGGTLRDLYKEHAFSLPDRDSGLVPLLTRFNDTVTEITNEVPNWHRYIYDATSEIRAGGMNLFDTGNRVSYRVNGKNNEPYTELIYNRPYVLYNYGVEIQTSATYPFVSLAWIGDGTSNIRVNSFDYRVESNFGSDGRGTIDIDGFTDVTFEELTARYTAFNVHGGGSNPSICEVYFYIGSTQLWNTTFPTGQIRVGWSRDPGYANNALRYTGEMSNILIGYALLSRTNALRVTTGQISNVLIRYMRLAKTFQYRNKIRSISVPVDYAVGDNQLVRQKLPTRSDIVADPGYIQFRAIGLQGNTNALCPGARVRSQATSRVCLGGSNTASFNDTICGDYAGWAGSRNDRGNKTLPSATGRSQQDIDSSILIFTR